MAGSKEELVIDGSVLADSLVIDGTTLALTIDCTDLESELEIT